MDNLTEIKIEYLPISSLEPYEKNTRKHNQNDVDKIALSIEKYGMNDPIGIWSDHNVIVEGHGRMMACLKLGYDTVPCIRLDHLTDEQRREYAIMHNKTAELSEWDYEFLAAELPELNLEPFEIDWGLPEVEELEAVEDDYDKEPPAVPKSQLGDIYQLGRHRLMCGSSTDQEQVQQLCGGAQVDMLLTDPPYGVDYEGKTDDKLKIENDKLKGEEFLHFLADAFDAADSVMKEGAVFYIWHADSSGLTFRTACEMVGWQVRQCLIWVKNAMVMGRQDYQWKHEPCQPAGTLVWTPKGKVPIEMLRDGDEVISYDSLSVDKYEHYIADGIVTHNCLYGWKEGAGHLWASDRKQTTVLNFERPSKSKIHPTMKPVPLFDYQMKNNTKGGDIVLDLFGGSGTTMIAAEQNGRTAYLMELSPNYCDAIIDRWETLTGEKAVLVNR